MKKLAVFLAMLFSAVLCVGCGNNNSSEPQKDEPAAKYIYVSNTGTGDGSYDSPCSLTHAIANMQNDEIVYLLGGTYNVASTITLNKVGTEESKYNISAYNNQKVVLDFGYHLGTTPKFENTSTEAIYSGIILTGSYYNISGITITGAGCCGMYISGHYNTIENCVFAENCNSGLQLSGNSSKTINSL